MVEIQHTDAIGECKRCTDNIGHQFCKHYQQCYEVHFLVLNTHRDTQLIPHPVHSP